MAQYKVQLESYEGPLDLLLQLIESQELDIAQVSLAQVTDQYIRHINDMEGLAPEEIADFLVIVARLLYIKSKVLLPTMSLDDEDGVNLENQLKLYKAFVEASKKINILFTGTSYCFSRTKYPVLIEPAFSPSENISPNTLAAAFAAVLKRLEPLRKLPKQIMEKVVHLSDKIHEIKELMLREATVQFSRILKGAESKAEKVVSFLALLELVKQKIIIAEQKTLFEDIEINKIS